MHALLRHLSSSSRVLQTIPCITQLNSCTIANTCTEGWRSASTQSSIHEDDARIPVEHNREASGNSTVDFGYTEVPRSQKRGLVGQVFSSVAPSYDVMNDLMSGGLHRLWKDRLLQVLSPSAGQRHLDVAGGTGDVAFRVLEAMRLQEARAGTPTKNKGSVTVFDINQDMLTEGHRRAEARGLGSSTSGLHWVQGDAEELPFPDSSMDSYTIAFGIRNVTNRDKALQEAYRVLRPGGRFLCLEFSKVEAPLLKQVYDLYSMNVIPLLGRVVANDEASYRYLVESIRRFPDQETFADMVYDAGFSNVTYENLTAGIVAIHSAFKLNQ